MVQNIISANWNSKLEDLYPLYKRCKFNLHETFRRQTVVERHKWIKNAFKWFVHMSLHEWQYVVFPGEKRFEQGKKEAMKMISKSKGVRKIERSAIKVSLDFSASKDRSLYLKENCSKM